MILHTQDRPFKCSLCDEYFKSRFARLKHQEKFHLGNRILSPLQPFLRRLHDDWAAVVLPGRQGCCTLACCSKHTPFQC